MKGSKLCACVLSFLSFSILGHANASENLDEFMLPETIITATRTQNTVENVPQPVKVITREDIERSGAYDLRSLLAHETGIMLKRALRGGGHEVMIRGVDSDKTLMLVNGRRLINEADSSGLGTKKGIDRININKIERIEVLKGPASALYGSDAIGGVINIILKKSDKKQGEVGIIRTTHDAMNYYRLETGRMGKMDATLDIKFDKNFRHKTAHDDKSNSYGTANAYDLSFNYFLNDDEYLNVYYNYYSRHGKSDNGEPKKLLATGKPAGAGMGKPGAGTPGAGMGKPGAGTPGTGMGTPGAGMGKPGAGMGKPGAGTPGTGMGKPGMGKPSPEDIARMKMMAAWNKQENAADKAFRDDYKKNAYGISYHKTHGENSLDISLYGGTFDWYDDYVRNRRLEDINDNKNKLYAFDARSDFTLDHNNRLTVGTEFLYNEVKGTNLGQEGANKKFYRQLKIATPKGDRDYTKYVSDKSIKTRAFYLQDEIQSGKLFFVPALRYDHHSVFGSHTSLKMGMTYKESDNLRFKLNYGDGFKAPSVSQLYFDISRLMGPSYVTLHGNPSLKPEKSRNLDLSVEFKEKNWQTSLAYFNNRIDNLIESEKIDPANKIYKFTNIKKAQISGVEHMISYHFHKNFDFSMMTTFLAAKDKDKDSYLMQRPRIIQLYQLTYDDHTKNGLKGTFWCEGNRDFYYEGGSTMRPVTMKTSYHVFGLTLNKTFEDYLTAFFTIENIFNKKDHNVDLDGRFSTIGLSYKF